MAYIINNGNTDDIKNSLKHQEAKLTIKQLQSDIREERSMRNRSTVIKMLEAAIERKKKAIQEGPKTYTQQELF